MPDKSLDSIALYWNGTRVESARCQIRSDVLQVHPWIGHADRSGFCLSFRSEAEAGCIDIVGCRRGRAVARLRTLARSDLDAVIDLPPDELMRRVGGSSSYAVYRMHGLKIFTDLIDQINKYENLAKTKRLLDWGCGCGRLTAHFLLERQRPEVHGCDIDGEAVEWCASHLEPGKFTQIRPYPPMTYRDATFDIVIGCSVFTHLSQDAQTDWLEEIKRIMVPGGLFLASANGGFAFSLDYFRALRLYGYIFRIRRTRPRLLQTLIEQPKLLEPTKSFLKLFKTPPSFLNWIVEVKLDKDLALEGIAPRDYYISAYQSRRHTIKQWGKHFEILDYIERGLNAHQDLVVMRRR